MIGLRRPNPHAIIPRGASAVRYTALSNCGNWRESRKRPFESGAGAPQSMSTPMTISTPMAARHRCLHGSRQVIGRRFGATISVSLVLLIGAAAIEHRDLALLEPAIAEADASVRDSVIKVIEGVSLWGSASWSPTSDKLLLRPTSGGVSVFNVDRPEAVPRVLISKRVTMCDWSPNGRWIACRVQDTRQLYRGTATLVVVNTSTGERQTLLRDRDFGRISWLPDGRIVVIEDPGAHPLFVDGPSGSGSDLKLGPAGRILVGLPIGSSPGLSLRRYDPSSGTFSSPLLAADSLGKIQDAIVEDILPGGSRYLVAVSRPSWRSVIVDTTGTIVATIGEDRLNGFVARSIDRSSTFAAGERAYRDSTNAMHIGVILMRLSTGQTIVISPDGMGPRFSRQSPTLAYERDEDTVYVTRITVFD